jgi:AcrR family transcriptional regulator
MDRKMAAPRRLGLESAKNRARLVDATEQLLREEGYVAITARQVAAKAGLKTQLIYYYFQTMDDLILALVQRISEKRLERFEQVMASPQPLRALWDLNNDPASAVISTELQSIAAHREAVRAAIVRSARQFRALQIEAVARFLEARGVDQTVFPAAAVVTITSALARALVTDTALDVADGYAEAVSLVERGLLYLGQAAPSDGDEAGAAPSVP